MKLKITKSKSREKAGLPAFASIQFSQEEIPMINSQLGLFSVLTEDIQPGRVSRGEGHLTHDVVVGTDDLPVRMYEHKGERWYYPSREEEKNDENRIPLTVSYSGDHYINCNDYVVVKLGDKEYPIDYLVAPLVTFLYDKGIKTMGSDQGSQDEHVFISFEYECLDDFKTLADSYGLVLED